MVDTLLTPGREIARYCKKTARTIENWRKRHCFPVMHLPDGALVTSVGLIDQWLRERYEEEQKGHRQYRGGFRIRSSNGTGVTVRTRAVRGAEAASGHTA